MTLLNPLGTVVKMFVVLYDLTDMPPRSHTFLRQRTLRDKTLRYLVHLRYTMLSKPNVRKNIQTDRKENLTHVNFLFQIYVQQIRSNLFAYGYPYDHLPQVRRRHGVGLWFGATEGTQKLYPRSYESEIFAKVLSHVVLSMGLLPIVPPAQSPLRRSVIDAILKDPNWKSNCILLTLYG